MTPESGAVELLALEFQPPHYSACACGFGLAAQRKAPLGLRKCLHLGRGSGAPANVLLQMPWGSESETARPPWFTKSPVLRRNT